MVSKDPLATQRWQSWRRQLHAHPETAYREHDTAAFVADKLREFGCTVHTNIAQTGVVGVLRKGDGARSVGLRADMDALQLTESNQFAHASKTQGKMHACGHDGHMAMLLGAAERLSTEGDFSGTVNLIFQPAEEGEAGAKAMLEDGLLQRFPMDAMYGLHNWPDLPVGTIATRPGPLMAAFGTFEITVRGRGGHAAIPHAALDPIVASAEIITGLQAVVSRSLDPLEAGVLSVTQVHGGKALNVIPDEVLLRGSMRSLSPRTQQRIQVGLERVVRGVCTAHEMTARVEMLSDHPATVNPPEGVATIERVAREVAGIDSVLTDVAPTMASEDFAYFLREIPGCYFFLGTGDDEHMTQLHNPSYDFNDVVLGRGVEMWVQLARAELAD